MAVKRYLHEKVRETLIDIILERNMKAQDILPSESEIAEICGVSKMTVKVALKNLEEEGVIYRLARRGSFLSVDFKETLDELLDGPTGSLRESFNKGSIALIVPAFDSYIGKLQTEIIKEAEHQGVSVIVRVAGEEPEKEDELLKELSMNKSVKGIILFPSDREKCGAELLGLNLKKYPIVIIDRAFKEVAFDSVSHDNYKGAYDMTKFLIDKGHREIGYISAKIQNAGSREERYLGYLHSLMENRVSVNRDYILFVGSLIHMDIDEHIFESPVMVQMETYLKNNKGFTAVFCSDDYIAVMLYYAANRMGIKVPDDLSIVGFSDNRILRFIPIKMTTVRQPVRELAKKAISLLQNRLDNPDSEIQDIKLDTVIVERSSVK